MLPLLALLPLIGQVLPSLIPAMATPMLGNIIGKAGDIATKIFGTTDPSQINLLIAEDANKLAQFKAELDAATQDETLAYQDIQSARNQTIQLAGGRSLIAWGAPIISSLVTVGFFISMGFLFIHQVPLDPQTAAIIVALASVLGTNFTQVVSYWVGSSRSSTTKDEIMATMSATSVSNAASTARDLASKVIAANGNGK